MEKLGCFWALLGTFWQKHAKTRKNEDLIFHLTHLVLSLFLFLKFMFLDLFGILILGFSAFLLTTDY